jgi:hypothetical protein
MYEQCHSHFEVRYALHTLSFHVMHAFICSFCYASDTGQSQSYCCTFPIKFTYLYENFFYAEFIYFLTEMFENYLNSTEQLPALSHASTGSIKHVLYFPLFDYTYT